MVSFEAVVKKFNKQGEKTGWTYIEIPAVIALQLQPGSRKSFRVKGRLDHFSFAQLALLPMGEGDFILPLNAAIRKSVKKSVGDVIQVKMEVDHSEKAVPAELMECLEDEPEALAYFNGLPKGHRNYFSNWISSAKTEETKARRIAACINAFVHHWDFGTMLREARKNKV